MEPYYDRAGVTLFHGRCEDVLPTLPAGGFDLVFTSPPYNLGTTSGGGFPGAGVRGHYGPAARFGERGGISASMWRRATMPGGLGHGYGEHDDAMPHDMYVAWQQAVLLLCWNLLSPTGAIFYNHKPRVLNGRLVTPLEYVPESLRPSVRQVVIWAKAGGINFSPAFYLPTHEWIVIIAQPDWRLRDRAASDVGDVWSIAQEGNTMHPAPFPVRLPLRAIQTTPCRMVLDPFAGSGTTLLAAKIMGVDAIGIESNLAYCDMAVRRLAQGVLPLPTEEVS